jgi:hypothetical protein
MRGMRATEAKVYDHDTQNVGVETCPTVQKLKQSTLRNTAHLCRSPFCVQIVLQSLQSLVHNACTACFASYAVTGQGRQKKSQPHHYPPLSALM